MKRLQRLEQRSRISARTSIMIEFFRRRGTGPFHLNETLDSTFLLSADHSSKQLRTGVLSWYRYPSSLDSAPFREYGRPGSGIKTYKPYFELSCRRFRPSFPLNILEHMRPRKPIGRTLRSVKILRSIYTHVYTRMSFSLEKFDS